MTITFRNQTNISGTILGSNILTKPTGTVEGDLMIVSLVVDTTFSDAVAPVGWVEIATIGSWVDMDMNCWWKRAGSSEPSTYTFTSEGGGASNWNFSSFYNSEGVGDWTLEHDVGNRVASSTSITSSSISTVANSLLYCSFGNDDNESVTSSPTDMTTLTEAQSGSTSQATYFELKNTDTLTKSISWAGGAEELGCQAVVFTNSAGGPTGTNQQINIGDAWKEITAKQINISDVWKEIIGEQINIGDSWKTIF